MKQALSVLLFLFSLISYSQINQETSFDYSGTYVRLQNSGDKFYIMDVTNSQCRVYNSDYSLWKTISLSIPADNYLYDIKYVSEGLFTTTNELCLAYIYYYYDEVNLYYTFNMKVIKENGTVLLSVPGCQYMNVYKLTSGSTKLVTYSYDYSIALYTITTKVFSLPGTITAVPESEPGSITSFPAFPNPASETVTIPYSIPDSRNGTIQLIDPTGKVVCEKIVNESRGKVNFNITGFPEGMYLYNIKDHEGNATSGKIMIR